MNEGTGAANILAVGGSSLHAGAAPARHMMGEDLPVVGARVCPECGHTLNSMSSWFSSHRVAALRQETHQPAGVAGQTHARFFSSCNESCASEFGGADTAKGVPA